MMQVRICLEMFLCHSDDRREEESRVHKVGVPEILRSTLFRSE